MPEEILFSAEVSKSREEIATNLRSVADALAADGAVKLVSGEQSVTLEVPDHASFEIKAERETNGSAPELSLELEIEWREGEESGSDGSDITIG